MTNITSLYVNLVKIDRNYYNSFTDDELYGTQLVVHKRFTKSIKRKIITGGCQTCGRHKYGVKCLFY